MTLNDWIFVAAALIGGVVVGAIASRAVQIVVGAESRPEPVRNAAGPLASLALWAGIVTGLVIALGIISPSSLDELPKDLVDFIPRVISAAIVVIIGNVLASFAQTAVAPAIGRMPAGVQRQILGGVRVTIVSLAVLLAVRQLGFDTTVINLAVAAIFFGMAGALMLLVALGGRHVATEVSSTRVLRRMVSPGDQVVIDDIAGTVVAIHPTAVEISQAGLTTTKMVPSSRFLNDSFTLARADSEHTHRS
ncbi:MAG: hypothetical protein AAGD35_04840 [Actinomycetota bacterium]